jgi:hypothetical protein
MDVESTELADISDEATPPKPLLCANSGEETKFGSTEKSS